MVEGARGAAAGPAAGTAEEGEGVGLEHLRGPAERQRREASLACNVSSGWGLVDRDWWRRVWCHARMCMQCGVGGVDLQA